MSSIASQISSPADSRRVRDSAQKLLRHIQASGFRPGDRYLSAKEAGRLVGESVMTVQRAMMLLAKQDVLERRPRAGTFVGPKAGGASAPVPCVHVLVPESFAVEQGAHEGYWNQIQGLRSVIPGVSVQFDFIPNQDMAYTRQVIEEASKGGSLTGVVLNLPSREMRCWFNQSGIPTVVNGGVEADLDNLGWLNWDQKQIGQLLADWLIKKGHTRLVTIMRNVWSIGEHMLHDGISESLSNARLPANAILVRSAPPEASAVRELVRGLLVDKQNCPTGMICRSEFQADIALEVVQENKLEEKIDITLAGTSSREGLKKFTSIIPKVDAVEQGRILGSILKALSEGLKVEDIGRNIPVKLHVPK